MPETWQIAGFGLYIHWPFCQAKCPYCDFNSFVSTSIDQDVWAKAYLNELTRAHAETSDRVLTSVFFGGGTPSLMGEALVNSILDHVRALWTCSNDLEVTLEANPSSVEAARFEGYRASGVNRVSIGVQALNDADLKRLGRLHSVGEALAAIELAATVFDRYSFDLIYARQDQTREAWQAELNRALALGPDHLSLYQLTIEPGTAFGDRHQIGKLPGLPDDDLGADMYLDTQEITGAACLPAYETSNHARDGHASRHNLIYWRGGDYVGIGPGAHGRLTHKGVRFATETVLAPSAWLKAVRENGSGESKRAALSCDESLSEYLMMSLRLVEGADLERISNGHEEIYNNINHLVGINCLERVDNRVFVTPDYRPVLNSVLKELLS